MTTQMIIRIESDLKRKVNNFARAEGKNISEIVRELLEDYVQNRDISSYIDDLWDRIGIKLKKQGITASNIETAIKEIRAKK